MKNLQKKLADYPSNIWYIAIGVLIPSLYALFNRYFIGFMGMESVIVEQSFESLEVLMEILLEMLPLALLAVASQNFRNKEDIKEAVKTTAIIQLSLTLMFTLVSCIGVNYFIDFINTPESGREIAREYFILKSIAFPLQSLALLFMLGVKTATNGRKMISISMFSVFINYIFDCLLISNFSFSLKMGLVGSAVSSILTQALTLLLAFMIFAKETEVDKSFFKVKIQRNMVRKILKIGKYNGLESFVRNMGYTVGVVAVLNMVPNELDIVAYNTVGGIFWSIILVPVLALSEGSQIAIGNKFGEKDYKSIKNIMKTTTIILGSWMLLWVIIGWFTIPKLAIWINSAIDLTSLKSSILMTYYIMIIAYISFTATTIINSYFIGLGRPKAILNASIIVNIVMYIPLGILCKTGIIVLTYKQILLATLIIYLINFLIMLIQFKKDYAGLTKESDAVLARA